MWFAARDIAFERPPEDLDIEAMLARMGFGTGQAGRRAARLLPDDIAPELEMMVSLMVRVLFIEISAFHTFAWAEEWMSDTELVAGDGEAAALVSYIRADETPHVGYLRTALSEMRDRTWIGEGGATPRRHRDDRAHLGAPCWPTAWDQPGRRAGGPRGGEVEYWCATRTNGDDILAEFNSLGAP